MILRCTAHAAALLVGPRSDLARPPADDEDWYANVFWVDRRKYLLLMHAGTLFPVVVADVRAPHWRPPGRPVIAAIEHALARERLSADSFGRLDPAAVTTAVTASRQLLGFRTRPYTPAATRPNGRARSTRWTSTRSTTSCAGCCTTEAATTPRWT